MKKFLTSTSEDLFLEVIILYKRQPLITYNIFPVKYDKNRI